MSNLDIYNALRTAPKEALKNIDSGRLKGKSDINPMWRIKAMTELFGACGIGWKYEVVRFWLEHGAGEEISAFAQINLYFKQGETWSDPVPGIGGAAFVAAENRGPHTSDECYKMALTDAISVACKALGVAADVYWDKDRTKYSAQPPEQPPAQPPAKGARQKPPVHHSAAQLVGAVLVKKYGKERAPEMLHKISGYRSLKDIPDDTNVANEIIKSIQAWNEPKPEDDFEELPG